MDLVSEYLRVYPVSDDRDRCRADNYFIVSIYIILNYVFPYKTLDYSKVAGKNHVFGRAKCMRYPVEA